MSSRLVCTPTGENPAKPHWKVTVNTSDEGITGVVFEVDTYGPVADVKAAMKHLTAVALWWMDTKQYESMGMMP